MTRNGSGSADPSTATAIQAGVDLNTVRELLGHADIKMTLRYSHLALEHRAAAVEKLVQVGG